MCVAVFVRTDEMGDLVDNIETILDSYYSDCQVKLLCGFNLLSFLNHSPFSLVFCNVVMKPIQC